MLRVSNAGIELLPMVINGDELNERLFRKVDARSDEAGCQNLLHDGFPMRCRTRAGAVEVGSGNGTWVLLLKVVAFPRVVRISPHDRQKGGQGCNRPTHKGERYLEGFDDKRVLPDAAADGTCVVLKSVSRT